MNESLLSLNESEWILKPSIETFHSIPANVKIPDRGIPAIIPGDVYLDLHTAGLIADPFFGDNESSLFWIANCDWDYETTFIIEETSKFSHLVFDGLDTFADIYLNGSLLGHADNMFIRYSFEIMPLLRQGKNAIKVKFYSALKSAELLKSPIRQLPSARHPNRAFVRKAQYAFGWDWGPAFPGVGIWKNVYLQNADRVKINHVAFETTLTGKNSAAIRYKIHFGQPLASPCRIQITLAGHNRELIDEFVVDGGNEGIGELLLSNPQLWWPHNLGEPNLYNFEVLVFDNQDKLVESFRQKVGIRTVELRLKEDGQDCFKFLINNVPLYLKGANWIPADSFLPRVDKKKYNKLITAARDANMNVLRVWGGGIYENDVFYQLCDQAGIMVWQDFMFACATYPENETFLDNVKNEITQNVHRLKNHPSIILWCGNNEIEWIWHQDYGTAVNKMQGFRLFHELMPQWLAEIAPAIPYWPSSPYGADIDPNSQKSGNRHAWEIWSEWLDYGEVVKDKSLFVSEFGFQAPATYETFKTVLPHNTHHVKSDIFEYHNKQDDGNKRLFHFLDAHLPVKTDIESFIYLAQLNQGFALKTCLEHWRLRWPKTAGSIVWQLNDCWPVSSWSVIDYELRRKHAYYFIKHSFQNLLPGFIRHDGQIDTVILNDMPIDSHGKMNIFIWDFENQSGLSMKSLPVHVNGNGRVVARSFSETELNNKCLIITIYDKTNNVFGRNFFINKLWKHVTLPKARYKIDVISEKKLLLQASSILFFLKIEHKDIEFEDFPEIILPGEKYRLKVIEGRLKKDMSRKLKIKNLNDYLCEM